MRSNPLSKLELVLIVIIIVLSVVCSGLFVVWKFFIPLTSIGSEATASVMEKVGEGDETKSEVEEFLQQGNGCYNIRDFDCAFEYYDQAVQAQPDYAEAYARRGNAYRKQGDLQLALEDCEKALQLDSKLPIGYFCRGNVYDLQNDYDQALADLDEAIRLDPQYGDAYNNRGSIYRDFDFCRSEEWLK